jgi:hypothetical protein
MKLLEKYIYAIGMHLPYKNRQDIKEELKSLLMDQIETEYGSEPTAAQTEKVIMGFGSPREVAARYTENRYVIGMGYYDLYFMIMKIIAGALAIAFVVVFAIELLAEQPQGMELVSAILSVPVRIGSTFIGGVGCLTLIFILMTRYAKENVIHLDDNWTIKELNQIQVGNQKVSLPGIIAELFFGTVFIVLLNAYPQVVTLAEEAFSVGIPVQHTINIQVFSMYVLAMTVLYLVDVVYNFILLKTREITKRLRLFMLTKELATVMLFGVMLSDEGLYLQDNGLLGFKVIFIIILVVTLAEVIAETYKLIAKK